MKTARSAHIKATWTTGLSALVAGLAFAATAAGILTAFGHTHRTFVTLRGESVTLQGGGLYANESTSMAAQGVGMDLVTLLVALPLLVIATYMARRGSIRGRMLQVGAFFYFAYSYLVILFGVTFNPFFLVYVGLLSASLAGLILSILSIDTSRLPTQFSPRFARRTIAWTVIGVSVMFLVLWLSRILPFIASGAPPVGLESYTTLSVQAADLSLVIPLSVIAGVLLLRHRSAGYLLIVPIVFFLATMGLALGAMVAAMAAMGTSVGLADIGPATATAAIGLTLAIHTVSSIKPVDALPRERSVANRSGDMSLRATP
jgi:membrane protein CcdC involved in cytochrome C biogenesis